LNFWYICLLFIDNFNKRRLCPHPYPMNNNTIKVVFGLAFYDYGG